jgi:hypothetical protein
VEGGLADGQLLADLADGRPTVEIAIGPPQLGDDLFRECASCLSRRVLSAPKGRLETLISDGTIFGEQTSSSIPALPVPFLPDRFSTLYRPQASAMANLKSRTTNSRTKTTTSTEAP